MTEPHHQNLLRSAPVIISAPFGNYHRWLGHMQWQWRQGQLSVASDAASSSSVQLSRASLAGWPYGVTFTVGTFTAYPRGRRDVPYGSKWWRALTTVRYSRHNRSWINRLGLKNPGLAWYIARVHNGIEDPQHMIVSVTCLQPTEWQYVLSMLNDIRPLAVEINASCPNVTKCPIPAEVYRAASELAVPVIVKIPPVFYEPIVKLAWENGIRAFHACNTIPTPNGGIGGKPLLLISQGVVSHLRQEYPTAFLIGGGGITTSLDAVTYVVAGANRVAVGSLLFAPWLHHRVATISKQVVSALHDREGAHDHLFSE